MRKKNLIFFIFLFSLLLAIILSPAKFIQAGLNGISAWAFNVLPAVLPFMIITSLLINTNLVEKVCTPLSKPFKKLYNTPPCSLAVFLISIMAGYPVGSKMIADLYEQDKITQTDAFRMSSFCSNSGPMFIVGSVGVGMLFSLAAGYIILASHIVSALINGFLYRKLKVKNKRSEVKATNTSPLSFGDIIENSCRSILNVGAIICFFFIIIEFVAILISFLPTNLKSVIFGVIEITKGAKSISSCYATKMATVLCSVVISFGGISTALQSISLLKRVNMPLSLFLLQKLTQSIFAGLISFCLCYMLF